MTLVCIDVHICHAVVIAEKSKLLSSSAEYYIGLLSLGRGHNVARLNTHALGSQRHAARLETSWPGQWLHYPAAVVYLIKGACHVTVMTVGDHGGPYIFIFCGGNCSHYPPPLVPLPMDMFM